jgi:hypothetical protein
MLSPTAMSNRREEGAELRPDARMRRRREVREVKPVPELVPDVDAAPPHPEHLWLPTLLPPHRCLSLSAQATGGV